MINPVLVVYALLMMGMGIEAYVAKGSMPSLIAGVAIGLLMLGSLALLGKNPRVSRISSMVVALIPLGRFLPALIQKQQIYPAGVTVVASLGVVIMLGAGHMMAMKKKNAG
jgi:uncharacterized membrane protein (UPF0136 family)